MDQTFFDNAQSALMGVLSEVRPQLMEAYGTIEFDTKSDTTVVTQFDKSVELKLREALKKLDSGIGLVGEEHGQEGNPDTYWLIDPIDGTEHFIRGLPGCMNLICLMDQGRPVWGLTYFFAKDELWISRAGHGTTMNGEKVEMRWRPLDRSWIEIAPDYSDVEDLKKVMELRKHVAGFSNRLGIDNLSAGRVDGLYNKRAGGGPWDYWPRYLMFTEAGGKMTNIGKDTYDFEDPSFLMAHPRNFDTLMNILK